MLPVRPLLTLVALGVLIGLGCGSDGGPVIPTELDRINERVVASPSGMPDSSWSAIYRDFTVPAGLNRLTVEHDYEVDSQAGADRLVVEYSTDGGASYTVLAQHSGRVAGWKKYDLPPGFPTVRVRFRYDKDATQGVGQDGAWIDNVIVRGDAAPIEAATHHFQRDWPGAVPAGWSAQGAGGATGMRVAWLPAARSVGPDDAQGAASITFLERSIQFPSANQNLCSFNYYIDTADSHQLRVYGGTTLVFESGGLGQGDSATVEMGSSPGLKTLRFELVKDSGPNAGSDVVRVDYVECFSDNTLLERHSFDGETPAATPSGWTTGCAGSCAGVSGWQVRRRTPHLSYLPSQPIPAPTLDGVLTNSEYPKRTVAPLPNVSVAEADVGELSLLLVDGSPPILFAHATVQADSAGVDGDEAGRVVLYLDRARPATLSRSGECPDWALPGPLDYRIEFDYALPAGVVSQTISAFVQQHGDCATGAWAPLGASPPLAVLATVIDSGDDRLGIELSVDLPADVVSDRLLGLALHRTAPDLVTVREHFPYLQDRTWIDPTTAPGDLVTYLWETLKLEPLPAVHGPVKNEAWDDCCYPRGERWRF